MTPPGREETAPLVVPEATNAIGAAKVVSAVPSGVFSPSDVAQMVLINVLWGGSSVAAKYALGSFGPFTVGALRFLPAGMLLLWLSRAERRRTPYRHDDWPAFLFMGLVGTALTYGIFNSGLNQTTATDSSLLFACEPLLLALFACFFLKERLMARQWSGLLLGVAGIGLIAGRAEGNWLVLLALCCESTTGVLGKRLVAIYPGLSIIAAQMLLGSCLLLPLAGWEIIRRPPVLTWQAVAGLLYLCLVCSALCYGVWYHALKRVPVSLLGVFILVQPLTGPLYGWVLRHEPLRPDSALGGALVILGIVLTTFQRQRSDLRQD